MKKTIKSILILKGLFVAFILTGCVTTQVANIQKQIDKGIEVYTTKLPNREYVEVKYIQASGSIFHGPEKLLAKLTERAKEEGTEAIINVKYDYQFWWPNVSGTAIKYKEK